MPLDIILGALLVGTWAGSLLYTVEVIQAAYYYRHFKHDNWMLKLLVTSAIAIDTMSMMSNYAAVYLSFRSYWKKHNRTHVIAQPEPFFVYTTGIVAAMAQSFLTSRYLLLIWLVAEAVTDIAIALALLLQFRKVKSPFKETRSLVNRLAAQSIQTGAAGATVAFASVAAWVTEKSGICQTHTTVFFRFLANNQSNGGFLGLPLSIPGSHIQVPTGIAYCLGRIYCITMLVVLNRRKTGKTWPDGGTSSGGNSRSRGEHGNQQRSEGGDEYGGIHVHRTAVVRIDTPQEFSKGSFKTNPGQGLPDDSPGVEIEMTVNDSASYSDKKKQDLFAP
ncbi:hypothetical protein DFH09DRAFT_1191094 [Mycena vulgaris]|nr:hypothetical protein DFH09DRAFT_1191094 [Mycena vulgaris]